MPISEHKYGHATQTNEGLNQGRLSPVRVVVRSILALTVGVLGWLCLRTSLAIEQTGQLFRQLFRTDAPSDLSDFLWQHPRVLLSFAATLAIRAIGNLAFSRIHRRAVSVAGVVVMVLLVQWMVITPAVSNSAVRIMQKAARDLPR